MKSKAVRIGKRIMAVMLSLMMVAGVFSGMKLDARAAGKTYWLFPNERLNSLSENTGIVWPAILCVGDTVKFETGKADDSSYTEIKVPILEYTGGYDDPILWETSIAKDADPSITLQTLMSNKKTYSKFKYSYCTYSTYPGYELFRITVRLIEDDENNTPSGSETNTKTESEGVVSSPIHTVSHICNFQWITTLDPTTGADGLEEYKCTGCGLVKESHPIPASVAAVKDFYGKVKDAPTNGTVTYDSGKLYTISDYLLKKMSERSDVAVTINFEYQNAKYELTFPAGTDYSPVLTDEETMYGYFGVAAKLGLTVVTK